MAEKLKEQSGDGVFIKHRRASAPATRTEAPPPTQYGGAYVEDEDDDAMYAPPPTRSAIRRSPRPQEEVYTRGNQKIVVHREVPKRRRFYWMIFMGMMMFVMVFGWLLLTAVGFWWQGKQDDWKYGNPRTFQIDEYVGHGDTPDHPDHFIAVNVGGMVQVIELNPQSPKYDHAYPITTINSSATPVFLSFEDTNHDGKPDMLVTIGDSNSYVVILLNNGTVFTH